MLHRPVQQNTKSTKNKKSVNIVISLVVSMVIVCMMWYASQQEETSEITDELIGRKTSITSRKPLAVEQTSEAQQEAIQSINEAKKALVLVDKTNIASDIDEICKRLTTVLTQIALLLDGEEVEYISTVEETDAPQKVETGHIDLLQKALESLEEAFQKLQREKNTSTGPKRQIAVKLIRVMNDVSYVAISEDIKLCAGKPGLSVPRFEEHFTSQKISVKLIFKARI